MNIILNGISLAVVTALRVATPQDGIGVQVNGAIVRFQAAPPMMWHSRVLVPLKDVIDELGGSTRWNSRTTSLTVKVGDRTARIKIGSQVGDVDDRDLWLDVAPRTVDGTTLVPLNFFADAFSANARWNEKTAIARIEMPRSGTRAASRSFRSTEEPDGSLKTDTPERREYRSLIMADGESGRTISEYDRFLVEQDFRRYQSDRVGWVKDYQNYRDGLLRDGGRGDFEPSRDYAVYLRQHDFEVYSNNQTIWRNGFNAFTRWRRTMNTTRNSQAFKDYLEARAGLIATAEKRPAPEERERSQP